MTGNMGIYGGEPAAFNLPPSGCSPWPAPGLIARRMPGNLPEGARQRPAIHITRCGMRFLTGKAGGHPADIKWSYM